MVDPAGKHPSADIARVRASRRLLLGVDAPLVEVDASGQMVHVGGDWTAVVGTGRPAMAAVDTLLELAADADAVIDAAVTVSTRGDRALSFDVHDDRAALADRRLWVVPIPAPGDPVDDDGVGDRGFVDGTQMNARRDRGNVLLGLGPVRDIGPVELSGVALPPAVYDGAMAAGRATPAPEATAGAEAAGAGAGLSGRVPVLVGWPAVGAATGSLLATVVLLWQLSTLDPFADDFGGPVVLWIAAFAALWLAVRRAPDRPDVGALAPAPLSARVALVAIVIVGVALRIVDLDSIPLVVFGDEGEQGLEARRVIDGEIRSPFTTGWLGVPTMSFFYHSLGLRIFGDDVYGLRMAWALVGIANVPAAYLLGRRLGGLNDGSVRFGLASAALVATFHFHVHYSRLGSVQISDALFLTVALWLLFRAFDRNLPQDWLAVGGVAGLAMYFYAGGRLTIVVLLAVFAYRLVCRRGEYWASYRHGLGVLVAGFVVVAAPMLQFAFTHWTEFNARLSEVGLIGSRWIDEQIEAGRSTADIWWQQSLRSLFGLTHYQDTTVWYGLEKPLLDRFFGIVFLVGLAWATIRVFRFRDERYAALAAWWWGGMLTGGFLTLHPPSTQRLVTLTVPTVMLIVVGLIVIGRGVAWVARVVAGGSVPSTAVTMTRWLVAASVVFGAISYKTYFNDHPRDRFGAGHSALMTRLADHVDGLDPGSTVWFAGEPFVYWGYGTMQFLVGLEEGRDLHREQMNAEFLLTLGEGHTEIPFVVAVERRADLDLIRSVWPTGETIDILTDSGHTLGTMYIARTGLGPGPTTREVDLSGIDAPAAVPVTESQVWRQTGIDGLREVRGIDTGPSGGALMVDVAGVVVELDAAGAPIRMVDITDGRAEFTDIAVDRRGTAWVADADNARLYRVSPDSTIALVPADPAALDRVRGISIAPDDTLWVASPVTARVTQLDGSGATLRSFEVPGRQPVDVAVVADGTVWVVDAERIELVQFSPGGQVLTVVPMAGFTSLEAPHLAAGGDGLWITDPETSTITLLDPATGRPIADPLPVAGPGGARLDKAIGLGVGADGRVWVVDAKNAAFTITEPSVGPG